MKELPFTPWSSSRPISCNSFGFSSGFQPAPSNWTAMDGVRRGGGRPRTLAQASPQRRPQRKRRWHQDGAARNFRIEVDTATRTLQEGRGSKALSAENAFPIRELKAPIAAPNIAANLRISMPYTLRLETTGPNKFEVPTGFSTMQQRTMRILDKEHSANDGSGSRPLRMAKKYRFGFCLTADIGMRGELFCTALEIRRPRVRLSFHRCWPGPISLSSSWPRFKAYTSAK
jgi:hypothetical protein